jgi:hypothetical protein
MNDRQEKLFKKLFTITWILLFFFFGVVAFLFIRDYNREPNVNNYIGKSAYQIAVERGYKGTEEMWVNTLIGPQGIEGKPGRDGQNGKDSISTHTVETNTIQKETVKEVPVKGDKGEKGDAPQMAFDTTTNRWYARYGEDDDWQAVPILNISGVQQLFTSQGDDE